MIQTDAATRLPTRSVLVTAVGWVFLAFSAVGTFIGIVQNIMLATVLPLEEIDRTATADPEFAKLPLFFRIFMAHPWLWFALALVISATTLVASIGLLGRRNWARRLFIGVLSLGVVWTVGSLPLSWSMFSSGPFSGNNMPEGFSRFFLVMQVFMAGFALGFAALFAWIIRRLVSEKIRAEFRAL